MGQESPQAIAVDDAFQCNYPFETLNAPHARDCMFLGALNIAQEKFAIYKFKPGDTMMSPQAGMVPFYLVQDNPGLRFIDPLGLGSPERIADRSLRGRLVVFMGYVERYRPEFIIGTGPPFGLGSYPARPEFEAPGYPSRVRLESAGYVPAVSISVSSNIFRNYDEVLWVRRDVLERRD